MFTSPSKSTKSYVIKQQSVFLGGRCCVLAGVDERPERPFLIHVYGTHDVIHVRTQRPPL